MNYDLSVLENDSTYITKLIDNYFGCDILLSRKVGEGFYGAVYLIDIAKEPHKIIVKYYKHSGRNLLEAEQLNLLRKYSLC